MKNNWKYIWILLAILSLNSCEVFLTEKDPDNNYEENFEKVWSIINNRYSLFGVKEVNWDDIYLTYKPRALSAKNDYEFFAVLNEMLSTLKDGHVNLHAPFDISRYQPYLDSPENFDFDLLERHYLTDLKITGYLLNQELRGVGYIYYGSFRNPINDFELDTLINKFKDLPGIIIDIRNNGGGNPENGIRLLSRLIQERTNIYNSQFKNGPGKNDFTPIQKIFLEPAKDMPRYSGKVVVLTNRKVYSAGSYFAAAIKALPQAILMGDHTGGGSGVPAGYELPNGWYFNYSASIGYTVDGLNFEGGVPVDIKVDISQ